MKTPLAVEWVLLNGYWLGYLVMALLGGVVGHFLSFEEQGRKLTAKQHAGCMAIACVKGLFIAACIYLAGAKGSLSEAGWSQPLCHLATGILSVFGTDTIKAIYRFVMRKLFGIQPEVKHDSRLD